MMQPHTKPLPVRIENILRFLQTAYPDARCELNFANPLELAVATILSAQCTDVRVNMVTPQVFARYRTAVDYAQADRYELENLIRSTGFFRNKTTSLIGLGQQLVASFSGVLPQTIDELITLPGIGRKTANVIVGNAFGQPGITVDTHVGRLARRWGFTEATNPATVESELGQLIPPHRWTLFSHQTIFHGRRICHSRRPACGVCFLKNDCPSYGLGPTEWEAARVLVKATNPDFLVGITSRIDNRLLSKLGLWFNVVCLDLRALRV